MYRKKYQSNKISGKFRVCCYLSAHRKLKRLIPHTLRFSKSNLRMMAGKYKSIYIKPDIGSQGIGVHKMVAVPDGYALYSIKGNLQYKHHFTILSSIYRHLKSQVKKKLIIQKTIRLDKINGRRYDVRAMVQRKPGKSWTCTGFIVKLGARDKIVTNYYQGGEVCTMHHLLKLQGLSKPERQSRIRHLTRLAVNVSRELSKRRAKMHEMGIDFAYDNHKRLWILEVNSNHPQFYPIKKVDPTSYNRMRTYARSYGRRDD